MTEIRKRSAIAFATFGLLGPFIRLVTWPPSSPSFVSSRIEWFVYDLVFYLWVTQPLAAYESQVGFAAAGAGAVVANVILWTLVGVAIGEWAHHRFSLRIAYGILACGLGAYAFWGAGFDVTYIRSFPFLVALGLSACPMWIVAREVQKT